MLMAMHAAVIDGLLGCSGCDPVCGAAMLAAHPPAVEQGGQVEQQHHSDRPPLRESVSPQVLTLGTTKAARPLWDHTA